MIPLLTLGIPGSASTVIMLAAFLIYGLQPGASLFRDHANLVDLIYATLILTNLFMVLGGLVLVRFIAKLAYLPLYFLAPLIISLCTIGAYTVRYNMIDLWSMAAFGFLGYLMKKNGFSIPSFMLGFILGPMAEASFLRSMMLFDNNILLFFSHPFNAVLLGLIFLTLFWAIGSKMLLCLRRFGK